MSARFLIPLLSLLAVAALVATALTAKEDAEAEAPAYKLPGQPRVEVLTPRNGSRHLNGSVVVRVNVENFTLAPGRIGSQPRLGEGYIKFSLNQAPRCVDPKELRKAQLDPRGSGRLVGRSFDFPTFSGANGLLGREIGSEGAYSPATEPQILYANLPPGFYRLVVTLARNDGASTPAHDVVTFEILPPSGRDSDRPCAPGKVAVAEAADSLN